MSKKIQDENGNTYVEMKPWYKKWWVWVLAVVVLFFIIGALGDNGSKSSSSSKQNKTTKSTGHTTTSNEKGESSTTQKITVSYKDYTISNSKTYSTNYTDTTWSPATVNVTKVVVYTLSKPTSYKSANDGTFQATGFVRMYFSVKANRDLSIYPTQGTYIFNGSEQHQADGMESWDGDISNGVTKTGSVTVPIKDASNLKTIRAKFDANYDTNNDDDNNSDHSYDFTLNL
jgi:hypothetical protein